MPREKQLRNALKDLSNQLETQKRRRVYSEDLEANVQDIIERIYIVARRFPDLKALELSSLPEKIDQDWSDDFYDEEEDEFEDSDAFDALQDLLYECANLVERALDELKLFGLEQKKVKKERGVKPVTARKTNKDKDDEEKRPFTLTLPFISTEITLSELIIFLLGTIIGTFIGLLGKVALDMYS